MEAESGFNLQLSKNGTYTLYFKIDQDLKSPVRRFTYYVTKTSTKKVVKVAEQIAAEKYTAKTTMY